ncbi:MAG: hypothetical protein EWM73_02620 [Nitrospira sp.]|nr:MAG: hypothetical protein EWM73_02620 [Nitrospira sp.]
MEPEQDFAEYRERLLTGMRAGIRRSACGAADPIQVFVNQPNMDSEAAAFPSHALPSNSASTTPHRVDRSAPSASLRRASGIARGGRWSGWPIARLRVRSPSLGRGCGPSPSRKSCWRSRWSGW